MAAKPLPPVEYLRQCLDYDIESGALTWRERPRDHFSSDSHWRRWNGRYPGKEAGSRARESEIWIYITVSLLGATYRAHRIIWKMIYGADPTELIDHIDGDGTNNRIGNMRAANPTQNAQNTKSRVPGRLKGVQRHKKNGTWMARIGCNNKRKSLGHFKTEELAHEAYRRAAAEQFGEFARFS